MALVLADRVKETSTTTGTGTFSLSGAASGFESFVAGVGNGNTTYYAIINSTSSEWEVGIGTVTDGSPDTLARTTILASSNADSAVNFSAGTKDVFCTYPATKSVYKNADGSISDVVQSITSSDGSINVSTVGSTVDIQVSEASPASTLLAAVRNETGATLAKGTVVYISGASGNKALVSKAQADSEIHSATTIGLITSAINNNQNGYITVSGIVSGLDTSAYSDGTVLYLSPSTAGGWTSTKPYAPSHLVYVGTVTYSHANQGSILTRIQNGYELDELHNVSAQSPTTGQTIVYNSSTSLWEKSNAPVISGTTIDNTTIGATTPSTGAFTTLSAPNPVASNGIFVNSQTVATSYTIASGQSGMSSGPVSIASGQSVTISSGSRWVVV